MALQNAFGDITLEATQLEIKELSQQIADLTSSVNTLVQFLYANSPRIDVSNRMTVNGSEVTQPVSGTVTATVANATVTTVTNLTQISGQPQQYQGQDVPIYIYDNVKVT
jgi:carbohydrate-binding DOMON domain-containing protein